MLSDLQIIESRYKTYSGAHAPRKNDLQFARAIESAACAERDARIAELEQQLAEARGGSSVFAFRYSSCTHEEGMRVVSLHSTQEAAREAMEQHRAEQKAEWDSSDLEVLGFPWSDEHGSGSERWDVIEMQVDAAIKEQT